MNGRCDGVQARLGDGPWRPLPTWISALVQLGRHWAAASSSCRIICIVAPPADDPVLAGLIALGGVVRRLSGPGADDLSSHYQRLAELAASQGALPSFRHRARRGSYTAEVDETGAIWFTGDTGRHLLTELNSPEWRLNGEPRMEARREDRRLAHERLYRALGSSGEVLQDTNLRRTDSFVMLACRPSLGRSGTGRALGGLHLCVDEQTASLADLLASHEWTPGRVCRTRLMSSRNVSGSGPRDGSQFDRAGPPPGLVVADGREALEAALASGVCDAGPAHAVAVIPKTLDREALQGVAATVTRLRQWYDVREAGELGVTQVPPGTSIGVLVQRG